MKGSVLFRGMVPGETVIQPGAPLRSSEAGVLCRLRGSSNPARCLSLTPNS